MNSIYVLDSESMNRNDNGVKDRVEFRSLSCIQTERRNWKVAVSFRKKEDKIVTSFMVDLSFHMFM